MKTIIFRVIYSLLIICWLTSISGRTDESNLPGTQSATSVLDQKLNQAWTQVHGVSLHLATSMLELSMNSNQTTTQVDIHKIPPLLKQFVKANPGLLECRIAGEEEKTIEITYQGYETISIPLYVIRLKDIENCTLMYKASMSSQGLEKPAYLEMWCIFPNEKAYFSRGLDQTLNGSMNWRMTQIPFYLKKGERPEKVQLGIRMEGPGEVQIKHVSLEKQSGFFKGGNWEWIPGTLLGVFGGLYGSVVGILAPRGRGRSFVLMIGIGLLIFSVGFLLVGVVFFSLGKPWNIWYPWLLPGVIGTALFSVLPRNIMRQYANAELRRMQAKDLMDSIS